MRKIEVKKIDGDKREINIEVSGDIIKNKFEDVFKRIAKDAKVPGFRPGNAPRDIIEKHYSSAAHEQVLKELMPDIYNEAIAQEKIDVIELPQINDVNLQRDKLSFKATVQISPAIPVKNYKGQKINYKKISVSADEIKRHIDSLSQARKADKVDDAFSKGIGYPNVSELEKAVEKQVFLQKDNLQRQRVEQEVIDNITKDLDFKLPQSLVSRQLEELVRQAKLDMALKGISRQDIDGQQQALLKELEPEAKKQVKIYLTLAEIAKKENIPQDDSTPRRVMEFLLREAQWSEEGG